MWCFSCRDTGRTRWSRHLRRKARELRKSLAFVFRSCSIRRMFWCVAYPNDDDRDGHRNVGILSTPNVADSPRSLYQVHSPWKHQDIYLFFMFLPYKFSISCNKCKCLSKSNEVTSLKWHDRNMILCGIYTILSGRTWDYGQWQTFQWWHNCYRMTWNHSTLAS
jgi:hypothetical protein